MTNPTDPRIAVVRQMLAAWDALDWQGVVDLFAEEGVLHSMMGEPLVGRKSIDARIKFMGEGLTHVRLNVKHIGVIDDTVYVERVDEFTYKGRNGAVPIMGAIVVRDGRVQEWREYYDRAELLGAMGIVEDYDSHAR